MSTITCADFPNSYIGRTFQVHIVNIFLAERRWYSDPTLHSFSTSHQTCRRSYFHLCDMHAQSRILQLDWLHETQHMPWSHCWQLSEDHIKLVAAVIPGFNFCDMYAQSELDSATGLATGWDSQQLLLVASYHMAYSVTILGFLYGFRSPHLITLVIGHKGAIMEASSFAASQRLMSSSASTHMQIPANIIHPAFSVFLFSAYVQLYHWILKWVPGKLPYSKGRQLGTAHTHWMLNGLHKQG